MDGDLEPKTLEHFRGCPQFRHRFVADFWDQLVCTEVFEALNLILVGNGQQINQACEVVNGMLANCLVMLSSEL